MYWLSMMGLIGLYLICIARYCPPHWNDMVRLLNHSLFVWPPLFSPIFTLIDWQCMLHINAISVWLVPWQCRHHLYRDVLVRLNPFLPIVRWHPQFSLQGVSLFPVCAWLCVNSFFSSVWNAFIFCVYVACFCVSLYYKNRNYYYRPKPRRLSKAHRFNEIHHSSQRACKNL